jgi:two-component system, chemotaxis family, sensor kinase CheA
MSKDSNVVLIIEDEKDSLKKHEHLVKSSGYIPFVASNGYTGLEILSKNVGLVDIVLLDLFMSEIDGLEVLRAIRTNPKKYGEVPVIILTNMTSEAIIKEAFQLGACSYLLKEQVDKASIIEELRKYI